MEYRPRTVDAELTSRLAALGAVLIEGPKACGKTLTARQVAASEVLLDVDVNARQAISVDPSLVLAGDAPRLIDEWQVEPAIWNHVRRAVDARGEPGQFILTGSAVPPDDETRHTGAGRITRLQMRPMSLFETGASNGSVSLRDVLAGRPVNAQDPGLTIGDLARAAVIGGWPAFQELSADDARLGVRGYLDEIRRVDVNRVGGARRDPERVSRLLASLARNVSTYASLKTLAADTGGPDVPLTRETVQEYLDVLVRLKIVEDQPAWAPHMRSKYVLRKMPKRHFVDPSLAVAALDASPERLLSDLEFFGFVFESMVVRDLRVYAQALDGTVLQYRDSDGVEVDAVVQTAGGWAAFEIKLGTGQVEEAASNLTKFAKRIDTTKRGQPGTLGVITGTGYGYRRDEDGVRVIPIGALGP